MTRSLAVIVAVVLAVSSVPVGAGSTPTGDSTSMPPIRSGSVEKGNPVEEATPEGPCLTRLVPEGEHPIEAVVDSNLVVRATESGEDVSGTLTIYPWLVETNRTITMKIVGDGELIESLDYRLEYDDGAPQYAQLHDVGIDPDAYDTIEFVSNGSVANGTVVWEYIPECRESAIAISNRVPSSGSQFDGGRIGADVELNTNVTASVGIYIDDSRVGQTEISGPKTHTARIDIGQEQLSAGRHTVRVRVVPTEGSTKTVSWEVTVGSEGDGSSPQFTVNNLTYGLAEHNGLSPRQLSMLWSRDNDSYVSPSTYRERYPSRPNRTSYQQIAAATDYTFVRPPEIAQTWSQGDYRDFDTLDVFDGGERDRNTSIYPANATTRSSELWIEDAHATVWAIHPSTRAHVSPTEHPLYVAPNGTVRGLVDFRVWLPANTTVSERRPNGIYTKGVMYRLLTAEIEEVRLVYGADESRTVLTRINGSHLPVLDYSGIERRTPTELVLEADINVTVNKTIVERIPCGGNRSNKSRGKPNGTGGSASGNGSSGPNATTCIPGGVSGHRNVTRSEIVADEMTFEDSLTVRGYNLTVSLHRVEYPDNTTGIVAYKDRPWNALVFDPARNASVRGAWRFYTARDRSWDRLIEETDNGSETFVSPALPVNVHAYPYGGGPRGASPEPRNPELLDVYGSETEAPALGENINLDVPDNDLDILNINRSPTGPVTYTKSYGIAVHTDDLEVHRVRGIVQGTTATIIDSRDGPREIREANLTVETSDRREDTVVLLITLRDNTTGAPIALSNPAEGTPIRGGTTPDRDGYIVVNGTHYETNAQGVVRVRVERSGVYTIRYEPGGWLDHNPAYQSTSTSVKYTPVYSLEWWLDVAIDLFIYLVLPGLVFWMIGWRFKRIFQPVRKL